MREACAPRGRSIHTAYDTVQSRKRRRAGLAGALRSTLGAAGPAAAPPTATLRARAGQRGPR